MCVAGSAAGRRKNRLWRATSLNVTIPDTIESQQPEQTTTTSCAKTPTKSSPQPEPTVAGAVAYSLMPGIAREKESQKQIRGVFSGTSTVTLNIKLLNYYCELRI